MLFTSLEFLFAFFPITLGIHFLLPKRARNIWLLLASLFFYAWGEPTFLPTMLLSIFFNYALALCIEAANGKARLRKLCLTCAIVGDLGLLFIYKYMNFITDAIHRAFPMTQEMFETTEFALPIGISFFTFQAISYVIDVYRGIPAQRNPMHLGLYIALFPQLIAGPIVRYTTVANEIRSRKITTDGFCRGMLRFVKGFNKKMLFANTLALVADAAFGAETISVATAWLGAVCYALQIFFDFGGYSEMAIGLGLMLGFTFPENFNYPYISKTVTEFWRRWHISLGSWFRDYLYFPLGGSRVTSKWRLAFNLGVVWLATGIWHGANLTFLLWGAWYGGWILTEKLFSLPQHLQKHRPLQIPYQVFSLLAVLFGWVLFRAPNVSTAVRYLCVMLGFGDAGLFDVHAGFYLSQYGIILTFGLLAATPFWQNTKQALSQRNRFTGAICHCIGSLAQACFFLISVSMIVMDTHNPFIYFNF